MTNERKAMSIPATEIRTRQAATHDSRDRGATCINPQEKHAEEPSDDELAVKAGQGDRGAFERLAWRWWDRIRGFCSALAGFDPEIAQDAAQETLIQLHRSISRWGKAGSFGSFLYGICKNVTKGMIRSRARTRRRQVSLQDGLSLEPEDPIGTTEEAVIKRDLQRQLAIAMRSLEIEDRELIYLHEAEGMAVKELAAMMGLPEGTIKSRLFRIRKKLATIFEEAGYG